jgi:hypothetical protein
VRSMAGTGQIQPVMVIGKKKGWQSISEAQAASAWFTNFRISGSVNGF